MRAFEIVRPASALTEVRKPWPPLVTVAGFFADRYRDLLTAVAPCIRRAFPEARIVGSSVVVPIRNRVIDTTEGTVHDQTVGRMVDFLRWWGASGIDVQRNTLRWWDGRRMRIGAALTRIRRLLGRPDWREVEMRRRIEYASRSGDAGSTATADLPELPTEAELDRWQHALEVHAAPRGPRKGNPVAVLSFDPVENAHRSTRRGWVSCYDPERYGDKDVAWKNVVCSLANGEITLWLTDAQDAEALRRPVGRTALSVAVSSDGRGARLIEQESYGSLPRWWADVAGDIVRAFNESCGREPGVYTTVARLNDEDLERVLEVVAETGMKDVESVGELMRSVPRLTVYVAPSDPREFVEQIRNAARRRGTALFTHLLGRRGLQLLADALGGYPEEYLLSLYREAERDSALREVLVKAWKMSSGDFFLAAPVVLASGPGPESPTETARLLAALVELDDSGIPGAEKVVRRIVTGNPERIQELVTVASRGTDTAELIPVVKAARKGWALPPPEAVVAYAGASPWTRMAEWARFLHRAEPGYVSAVVRELREALGKTEIAPMQLLGLIRLAAVLAGEIPNDEATGLAHLVLRDRIGDLKYLLPLRETRSALADLLSALPPDDPDVRRWRRVLEAPDALGAFAAASGGETAVPTSLADTEELARTILDAKADRIRALDRNAAVAVVKSLVQSASREAVAAMEKVLALHPDAKFLARVLVEDHPVTAWGTIRAFRDPGAVAAFAATDLPERWPETLATILRALVRTGKSREAVDLVFRALRVPEMTRALESAIREPDGEVATMIADLVREHPELGAKMAEARYSLPLRLVGALIRRSGGTEKVLALVSAVVDIGGSSWRVVAPWMDALQQAGVTMTEISSLPTLAEVYRDWLVHEETRARAGRPQSPDTLDAVYLSMHRDSRFREEVWKIAPTLAVNALLAQPVDHRDSGIIVRALVSDAVPDEVAAKILADLFRSTPWSYVERFGLDEILVSRGNRTMWKRLEGAAKAYADEIADAARRALDKGRVHFAARLALLAGDAFPVERFEPEELKAMAVELRGLPVRTAEFLQTAAETRNPEENAHVSARGRRPSRK